jgi:acyl-CoA reductase-like NAD-dependent aldehyde dehydrogenase
MIDAAARLESSHLDARQIWHGAHVQSPVLTSVTDAMPVCRKETFGLVVALYPVRNAEEVIIDAMKLWRKIPWM